MIFLFESPLMNIKIIIMIKQAMKMIKQKKSVWRWYFYGSEPFLHSKDI